MEYTWCGVLTLLTVVTAEVATSGYKLTVVCQKEGKLVEALDRYVTITLSNQSHVDGTVQRFLSDVKEERSIIDDIAEWIGHPINAFHLVERTVNGWREVQRNINCRTCVSTTATHEFNLAWKEIIKKDSIWSSSDDVITAAKGLGRLYTTYDLDIKTLISGTILNTRTSPLTTADVMKIANYLEVNDQIKWYKAFLELLGDVTKNETIIYKLAIAYHLGGMPRKALGILTELQPTSTLSMDTMIKNIRKKVEMTEEDIQPNEIETFDDIHDYRQLCQGNIQMGNVTPSRHCYNTVTRIPYYIVKEEVLSDVPRISRFHDVISDAEISQLQKFTKPILTRAKVFTDGIARANDNRIGESAHVPITIETSLKLEKRIEIITGLDTIVRKAVKTTEKFQVVNYGIGGHYSYHYDALDMRNRTEIADGSYKHDDRIATWIFYLNTVEAGGATVFPLLNMRILPIKGSAIFWYNLLPSGEVDFRTKHASCPVLLGSKWVTTKWIRERGQEFRKPCKTHPMAEHF